MCHGRRSTKIVLTRNSRNKGLYTFLPSGSRLGLTSRNYCRFHKGHGHNTDNYIKPKDFIEVLIKRGQLAKYVIGGKRERKKSPKGKFLSKTLEAGTNGGDKKASKSKNQYIIAITGGALWENLPSKGTIKRKIVNFWPSIKGIEVRQQKKN